MGKIVVYVVIFRLKVSDLISLPQNPRRAHGGMFCLGVRCVQSGASIDHTKEQLFKGDWIQIESAF